MKVLAVGGGSAVIAAVLRQQHMVIDHREEFDKEIVHHFLNVQGVLAGNTTQTTGKGTRREF